MQSQYSRIFIYAILVLAAVCALAACAADTRIVNHSFGFDVRRDGQDAIVLDYRYGESKLPVRAPEEAVKKGEVFYFSGVTGPMLRGDYLYVKWRNKNTDQVYEDTVDLRSRLPDDITDHRVYFMIRGAQLYVYLIPPESKRRLPGAPSVGPRMYSDLDTKKIYPD